MACTFTVVVQFRLVSAWLFTKKRSHACKTTESTDSAQTDHKR